MREELTCKCGSRASKVGAIPSGKEVGIDFKCSMGNPVTCSVDFKLLSWKRSLKHGGCGVIDRGKKFKAERDAVGDATRGASEKSP